jgi:hypothetical protein
VKQREARDYCPRCRVAYEPLQEYCLECGTRLPTNRGLVGTLAAAWQRRIAWYPGDWIWPVLAFFVLTVAATAAAVAAASTKSTHSTLTATQPTVSVRPPATSGPPATTSVATAPAATTPTTTNGPLPTAPGETTTPAPAPPPVRTGLVTWPAGTSGYTDVLESIPVSAGRAFAEARARVAARQGLPSAGVLLSSDYSSLHPGYYVVFSGIYRSSAEAVSALAAAHADGWPGAYQVRVTR